MIVNSSSGNIRRNHKFESELWRAIVYLAKNSTGIKKRLEDAYEYHIQYLTPDSIPQEIYRNKLAALQNKLTKKHTMPVSEAIHHLPFKSCRSIVQDLCDIYDAYINT